MKINAKSLTCLAVLILGLTAVAALPVQAQPSHYDRGQIARPMPPRVAFRRAPRWTNVPGSRVMVVRSQDRPGYDYFRVGSYYYIYDNGYWYRANSWRGSFVAIDLRLVPVEFNRLPRQYWRNYPANWGSRSDNDHRNGQDRRDHRGGNR